MIGRAEEIKQLKKAYESGYSEFVTVYGRRRIGKTFLVNEVFGYKFAFHVAGVKGGKKREQLEKFRYALIRHGAEKCPRLTSWLHAFHELEMLLEAMPEGRKVVFVDEMPWMDTHGSGFLSALESFWNEWASCRKDIVLIACGSATSWIVKKINHNAGGLYNRVRTQIKLYPFTLAECEAYAAEQGLSYSRSHIAECYMVFGGVAYYWSLLEKGKSPEQNVNKLFFDDLWSRPVTWHATSYNIYCVALRQGFLPAKVGNPAIVHVAKYNYKTRIYTVYATYVEVTRIISISDKKMVYLDGDGVRRTLSF